jgi:hypothetical protein
MQLRSADPSLPHLQHVGVADVGCGLKQVALLEPQALPGLRQRREDREADADGSVGCCCCALCPPCLPVCPADDQPFSKML